MARPSVPLISPSKLITSEVLDIWQDEKLANDPLFLAAYIKERYREAILWSFYFVDVDQDSSGQFSQQERQTILEQLGGIQSHDTLLFDASGCTLTMEDCFGGSAFFSRDQEPEATLADISVEHLFKWQAYANPSCGDCVRSTILARGLVGNVSRSECHSLEQASIHPLGDSGPSWTSLSTDDIADGMSDRNTILHYSQTLLYRYVYEVVKEDNRVHGIKLVYS